MKEHSPIQQPKKLLIGIFTTPSRYLKRVAARNTWVKSISQIDPKYVKIEYKFVIGAPYSYTQEENVYIKQEIEQYGDIISVDVQDTYLMKSYSCSLCSKIQEYGTKVSGISLLDN